MSNVTFDFFSIKTVPADYSWDNGSPLVEFSDSQMITDASILTGTDSDYIGYAPFVTFSLSSQAGTPSLSSIVIQRSVDFGDYYNFDSNSVMNVTLSNVVFCHNYIMPGLYTVKLTKTEYVNAPIASFQGFQCAERYCEQGITWSWSALDCEIPTDPSITWNQTLSGETWEKRWTDRPEEQCSASWATTNGLYIEPGSKTATRYPFSWQWYNFLCESQSSLNTPATWAESKFQQPQQFSWSESGGPCINFEASTRSWIWNNITCNLSANPFGTSLTWDQSRCSEPEGATWDTIKSACSTFTTTLSSKTETIEHIATLRVIEIPPTAYLEVTDISPNKLSPLTVRLSPRFIRAGSFPIEKIVWDLGDGTPLLTQKRWSPATEAPFVFSNIYNLDWQDPRNYDIVHTYNKTFSSGFSFYPSLTAYASSTSSSDCAAAIVGPLKLQDAKALEFTLLQNELTNEGKVLIGEVDGTATAWRTDK
jgi:hypothetical protein